MHNDVAPCYVRCTFGNLWQHSKNVSFPAALLHRLTFIFLSEPHPQWKWPWRWIFTNIEHYFIRVCY